MAMFGRATRNDVLRSYTPTMAERIPIAVQGFLGRLGLNKYQARSFGQPIADVLGYSPVGAVAQSWDAGQSAARAPGMFGKAAGLGGGMALAALGAVPGGKALARKGEALAMDEASRMARAEAMGFDTSQMYLHGTTKDFGKFQPSRDGTYGGGIYLTKDPITADAYSTNGKRFYDNAEPDAGSQVMPVFIRPGSDEAAGSTRNIKVKDARDIRSKFAAFDPAKRGSANLLAGLGVGAMIAPSMFGNRGGER